MQDEADISSVDDEEEDKWAGYTVEKDDSPFADCFGVWAWTGRESGAPFALGGSSSDLDERAPASWAHDTCSIAYLAASIAEAFGTPALPSSPFDTSVISASAEAEHGVEIIDKEEILPALPPWRRVLMDRMAVMRMPEPIFEEEEL